MQKTSVHEFLDNQKWLLGIPDSRVDRVAFACDRAVESSLAMEDFRFSTSEDLVDARGRFYVIRDDLLHPTVGGNKMRKLDAVIPFLKAQLVTDVVTCGGCQSAHAAAVAVVCAEHGMKAHLLLRGERLTVPTGYNLISAMYGNVTFVPRSEYADRETMLKNHAERIAASGGSILSLNTPRSTRSRESSEGKHVALVEEGAGNALALLGLIRLVAFLLSKPNHFSPHEKIRIVVDTGTGTTAVGLAVGIALFELPWEVIGVMLADTREGYEQQREKLITDFVRQFELGEQSLDHLNLVWHEREHGRKFGAVLTGEISGCKKIARETGILLDPIYTLAAWETSIKLSFEADAKVVMLHTGGTLGLFGLAQRYAAEFTCASSE